MATTALTVAEETQVALKPLDCDYLPPVDPKAVEQAMLIGDLSKMTNEQRIAYYVATCRSLGLNPLTKPFQALADDDGTLKLYPDKGLAEQLRKRDRVSTRVLGREILDGLYIVTVLATTPDGREEEAQGIVPLVKPKGTWEEYQFQGKPRRRFKPTVGPDGQEVMLQLSPTERANAMKRAETQGKRRATLAICGLGFPDYEAEPTSSAHPQALSLRTRAPEEAAKDVSEHIADMFGDTSAPATNITPSLGTQEVPARMPRAAEDRSTSQAKTPEMPQSATRRGQEATNAPGQGVRDPEPRVDDARRQNVPSDDARVPEGPAPDLSGPDLFAKDEEMGS